MKTGKAKMPVATGSGATGTVVGKRARQSSLLAGGGAENREREAQLRKYLVEVLGHPAEFIVANPDVGVHIPPDFLVFRDTAHKKPLAALYVTAPDRIVPVLPPASEGARLLGAEYCFVGSVERHAVRRLPKLGGEPRPARAIPVAAEKIGEAGSLPKDLLLPPWRDEHDFRATIRKCHTELFVALGHDPAAAFDELMKILLTKVYDESGPGKVYRFCWSEDASDEANSLRLRNLATEAFVWAASAFEGSGVTVKNEDLASPPQVLRSIVRSIQAYSVTETAQPGSGTDVWGVLYESVVGSTFRGELGSYFTPRNIVDFMVKLVLPLRGSQVFDIACGSGGFLVGALGEMNHPRPDEDARVFGVDLNPRMVRTARLNLLLHGQDPKQVIRGDGLQLEDNLRRLLPDLDRRAELAPNARRVLDRFVSGPFDVVFANPPFAGFEKERTTLEAYVCATRANGTIRSLNKTIPFMEAILASLKEGGVAGVVIPISILNAEEESFLSLRDLLLQRSELLSIIGLPRYAFHHTGCGVEGALLFFRRAKEPRKAYDVFVADVQNLGYDRLGKPTRENDLVSALRAFHSGSWPVGNRVPISKLRTAGRFDPVWLLGTGEAGDEGLVSRQSSRQQQEGYVPLTQLVQVTQRVISRREIDDDTKYRFFEVNNCDINTGEIRAVNEVTGYELKKKNRVRQVVRTGDVLLPNHRDSLKAKTAEGSGRSVVLVPPELDGVLTTDRFLILEPLVDPTYVVTLLNSRRLRESLIPYSRGSASLDVRPRALEKILVPHPDQGKRPELLAKLAELSARERAARKELRAVAEQQASLAEAIFD